MDTTDLDMTPRYLPDSFIIANWNLRSGGGSSHTVVQCIFHPAGTHRGPIREDWPAVQAVTEYGSRWFGCTRAYINSELRMVVIGTPQRDEVRMKWEIVPEDLR